MHNNYRCLFPPYVGCGKAWMGVDKMTMDTQEYQDRIAELEFQLQDKKDELGGVLAKYAALQLKNIAGLGGHVQELTSVNEQLASAKVKLEEVEGQVGRLAELESLLESQKNEIARLKRSNTPQNSLNISPLPEPEHNKFEVAPETNKSPFQAHIEQVHKETIQQENSNIEPVNQNILEREEIEIVQGRAEELPEDIIEPAPVLATPITPQVVHEKEEISSQIEEISVPKNVKKEESQQVVSKDPVSEMLPDDVLKKWIS
jgi:hypothetical protein